MTSIVCGLDEAGRGPLAGPVVAGAVILPDDFPAGYLNDSKKLSEKRRRHLEKMIKASCRWGIGVVPHTIIDEINILQASLLAMSRAFTNLAEKYLGDCCGGRKEHRIEVIVDGLHCPVFESGFYIDVRSQVRADSSVPEVMAASILAKVARDRIMLAYDKIYPAYGYGRHKGYPTCEHRAVCRKIGPSPIQRLSFKY